MLKTAFYRYINNFKGFTREIWILAIITFINRAGTMVLPFLSKYLKENLHFSYSQVGWIMVCFGFGSMLGSWLGGKLSDKIGFYKIMIFSLFTSGIGFLFLQYVTSFVGLCIGMFSIMVIADMFRPAMFVSLGAYAKPENRTRALTLVRIAVNLGFAAAGCTEQQNRFVGTRYACKCRALFGAGFGGLLAGRAVVGDSDRSNFGVSGETSGQLRRVEFFELGWQRRQRDFTQAPLVVFGCKTDECQPVWPQWGERRQTLRDGFDGCRIDSFGALGVAGRNNAQGVASTQRNPHQTAHR